MSVVNTDAISVHASIKEALQIIDNIKKTSEVVVSALNPSIVKVDDDSFDESRKLDSFLINTVQPHVIQNLTWGKCAAVDNNCLDIASIARPRQFDNNLSSLSASQSNRKENVLNKQEQALRAAVFDSFGSDEKIMDVIVAEGILGSKFLKRQLRSIKRRIAMLEAHFPDEEAEDERRRAIATAPIEYVEVLSKGKIKRVVKEKYYGKTRHGGHGRHKHKVSEGTQLRGVVEDREIQTVCSSVRVSAVYSVGCQTTDRVRSSTDNEAAWRRGPVNVHTVPDVSPLLGTKVLLSATNDMSRRTLISALPTLSKQMHATSSTDDLPADKLEIRRRKLQSTFADRLNTKSVADYDSSRSTSKMSKLMEAVGVQTSRTALTEDEAKNAVNVAKDIWRSKSKAGSKSAWGIRSVTSSGTQMDSIADKDRVVVNISARTVMADVDISLLQQRLRTSREYLRVQLSGFLTFVSELERDVVVEINLVRTEPHLYSSALRLFYQRRMDSDGTIRLPGPYQSVVSTEEGWNAVEHTFSYLSTAPSASPVSVSAGLCMAALEHAADRGASAAKGHFGKDGSTPIWRAKLFGTPGKEYGEVIRFGSIDAEELVMSILVDDGVASRGNRESLMSAAFRVLGVAMAPHSSSGSMLVIDMTDQYAEVASEAGVGGCDLAEALENSCVTLAVLKLKDGMKLSERVSYGCILAKMAATPDKRALLIDGGVVQELQLLFTSTTAQQSSEDSVMRWTYAHVLSMVCRVDDDQRVRIADSPMLKSLSRISNFTSEHTLRSLLSNIVTCSVCHKNGGVDFCIQSSRLTTGDVTLCFGDYSREAHPTCCRCSQSLSVEHSKQWDATENLWNHCVCPVSI